MPDVTPIWPNREFHQFVDPFAHIGAYNYFERYMQRIDLIDHLLSLVARYFERTGIVQTLLKYLSDDDIKRDDDIKCNDNEIK